MPLAAGTRLGPYEIVAPIGAGGMSACGRTERAGARCQTWGWGPTPVEEEDLRAHPEVRRCR